MAYIDKELFKQDIKMRYCNNCARPNEIKCRACNIDDMLGEIEDAPTADVVEVKHGEWISYETEETYGDDGNIWYKCSVCGTDALGRCYEDEWYSHPIKSGYCNKCGAKMDKRRDT